MYQVSADSNQNCIFDNFLKVAQQLNQKPCTIVQGILSQMTPREFSIFIIFSDTYTCSYVMYQF